MDDMNYVVLKKKRYEINELLEKYNELLYVYQDLFKDTQLDTINQQKFYYFLKRLFWDFIEKIPVKESCNNTTKIVWWLWLQGFENAPEIVKCCCNSLKAHFNDYKIIVVDEKSLKSYISIPDYVLRKYKKNMIGKAHFSDLVRTCLLEKYGGIWIDSTVYCTGENLINDGVFEKPLFFYKFFEPSGIFRKMDNWLMSACKLHPVMTKMKYLLFEYWKNFDEAHSYFIYNILFNIVLESEKEAFSEVPTFSPYNSFIFGRELFTPYCPERFAQLCRMTDFHKFTFRIPEDKQAMDGTFYRYILQREAALS